MPSFAPSMSDKTRFHFTGICGTAMGAVAAAMKQGLHRHRLGPERLSADVHLPGGQGRSISEGYREENILADADLVVIGNAISRGNPEAEAVLDRKLLYRSLPEVLKEYLHARQTHARRDRHPRQDHHHLAADVGASSTTGATPAS